MNKAILVYMLVPWMLLAQERLVLSDPEMTLVPDEVFAQTGLRNLHIERTKINKLSPRIGELTALEQLLSGLLISQKFPSKSAR